MRDWQLTAADPMTLRLAADVRLFETDYADDQIWELVLGEGESPALALQTRYGGRCGLARLVPMWVIDGRVIYQANAYAEPPTVRTFWPSYLRLAARPAPHLALQAEYWVMESHAVGGRFTFHNEARNGGERPRAVGVDLFAQFMTAQEAGQIDILVLDDGRQALHLRDVGNLQPVVLMEIAPDGGDANPFQSPKLATRLTVPPGGQVNVRWVHAGRPDREDSLALAYHWLHEEDWAAHLERLGAINATTPQIETGDAARDAAIAFSYKVTLGSFVGPTEQLPHPSFVLARLPGQGYSPRGDGSDHSRGWRGQMAAEAYIALPAVAPAAPELAMGVIRNYLAASGPDGFIDWRPGLGGQRQGMLSMPLLATTALNVYAYTEDRAFLGEVFPGLVRFFHRWFGRDVDRDGDGLPEWASIEQSDYGDNPTFAPFRRWAQNVDVSKAETPDLAAYLIREGRSLLKMADLLGKKAAKAAIEKRLRGLRQHLAAMWRDASGSFHYRDRDTHVTTGGGLLAEGEGGEVMTTGQALDPPNRLVVRVLGGRDHRPALRVTLEGVDADGAAVSEGLPVEAFLWYRGFGAATTERVYARLDRVTTEGLSRVYTVQVSSVDWTRQDLSLLLPLWAGPGDAARSQALVETITDPARYWRAGGLPACPAQEAAYDPANRDGSGGVRLLWNVMLGEGLIEAGRPDLAAALLERILAGQIHCLRTEKGFREAYNPDAPEGLGEVDAIGGVVPLHLLWRLMGVRIISPGRVWVGGDYALPWPVRVRHLGVTVERTAKGARITFPSGHQKRVRSARWQAVEDPQAPEQAGRRETPPRPGPPPSPRPRRQTRTVTITVQSGNGDSPDPAGES